MPDYVPPPGYEGSGHVVGKASGLHTNVVRLPANLKPGTVVVIFPDVDGREWRVMDDGNGGWSRPVKDVDGEWKHVGHGAEHQHVTGICDYNTGACCVAFYVAPTTDTEIRAIYRVDDPR